MTCSPLKLFSAVGCDLRLRLILMSRCDAGINHERERLRREMAKGGDVMKMRTGSEFQFHVPFLSLNGMERAGEGMAS
jgi:hypothetical protein